MGDMIDRDAAIGALEERRDKYLKDSQTWLQIQLDILAIRALPAASAEDVRAGALKEALDNKEQLDIWAQEILEGLGFADVLKIESYEDKIEAHSVIGRGIVEVLRALIPKTTADNLGWNELPENWEG